MLGTVVIKSWEFMGPKSNLYSLGMYAGYIRDSDEPFDQEVPNLDCTSLGRKKHTEINVPCSHIATPGEASCSVLH